MELKTLFTQDSEGEPLSNALCYLYERGTKTMATVYDAGGESIGQPFSSNAGTLVVWGQDSNEVTIPAPLTDGTDKVVAMDYIGGKFQAFTESGKMYH